MELYDGKIKKDINELDREIASHESNINGAFESYLNERYAKMETLRKKLATYRNYIENTTTGKNFEAKNDQEFSQAIAAINAQIDKTSFLMSELSEYDWHIKENVGSFNSDNAIELLSESMRLQKTIEDECAEIFEVCSDVANAATTCNVVSIMKKYLDKHESSDGEREPNED